MKKFNFKKLTMPHFIGIMFIFVVLLTWIVGISGMENSALVSGTTKPLGFMDIIRIPFGTLVNFIHIGLLVLVTGGFYAIVNETGVYSRIVRFVENKLEKQVLLLTIILLVLLSSLFGVNMLLFVLVPFFATILFRIGYDKLTVFSATIGSILLGNVGATYSSYVATPLKHFLSLDINSAIISKFSLLIVIVLLFTLFVVERSKKEKVNKKTQEITLFEDKNSTKKSALPLIIVLIFGLLISLIAMYDWYYTFEITLFSEIHENIMALNVFDYPIFKNLIGSVNPFGTFTIYDLTIILAIMSMLITWLYNIKLSVAIDKFFAGVKVMVKPAIFAVMANIVFYAIQVTQGNSNIFYTLVNAILDLSVGFNVVFTTIATIVGSLFYSDFTQFSNVFAQIVRVNITSPTQFSIIALLMQSLHGIMMMILPTSTILVLGLTYFEVRLQDWLGYIWKFLLQLFAISIIVALLTNLFI